MDVIYAAARRDRRRGHGPSGTRSRRHGRRRRAAVRRRDRQGHDGGPGAGRRRDRRDPRAGRRDGRGRHAARGDLRGRRRARSLAQSSAPARPARDARRRPRRRPRLAAVVRAMPPDATRTSVVARRGARPGPLPAPAARSRIAVAGGAPTAPSTSRLGGRGTGATGDHARMYRIHSRNRAGTSARAGVRAPRRRPPTHRQRARRRRPRAARRQPGAVQPDPQAHRRAHGPIVATSPHVLQAVEVDFLTVEQAAQRRGASWKAREGFSLTLPAVRRARRVPGAPQDFPHVNASVDGDAWCCTRA